MNLENLNSSTYPFKYWEISNCLNDATLNEISYSNIPNGQRAFDGTRAADDTGGGVDGKLRLFIDKDNSHNYPNLTNVINELKKKEDDILKQKNVISKEEYVKNVSLFQKEVQTYRQEKNKRNNNLSKIKIDHVNELLKQLSPLIANFSKENNISVVIDKKFTIVSKIEADITVKLIKILDSKIKKIDVN